MNKVCVPRVFRLFTKKVLISLTTALSLLVFPISAFAYSSFTATNVSYDSDVLNFDYTANTDFTPTSSGDPDNIALFDTSINDYIGAGYFLGHGGNATCNSSHCSVTLTYLLNEPFTTSNTYYISVYQDTLPGDGEYRAGWTPTPTPQIIANPSNATVTQGTPFTVDIVADGAGTAFNAAQATLSFDNLTVNNIFLHPSSNACDFHYIDTPTQTDPSFAGAVFGNSTLTSCKVYTLSLTPASAGTAYIHITNAHLASSSKSDELISNSDQPDATFTVNAAGPTPTPTTPLSQLTVSSDPETYQTSFLLQGGYLEPVAHVFVNGDEVTAEEGTWSETETLSTGDNQFTIYGKDSGLNQTATQVAHVNLHDLGDIDGVDGVNLVDASLFAADWGHPKSEWAHLLSDMDANGVLNLKDFSILAKLITL